MSKHLLSGGGRLLLLQLQTSLSSLHTVGQLEILLVLIFHISVKTTFVLFTWSCSRFLLGDVVDY